MKERFDGVLLHVCGYKEREPFTNERPSMRTRLVAAAARELFRANQARSFVLSGKNGPGYDNPISIVTADYLNGKIPSMDSEIIVNSNADITTSYELKTLKDESNKHGWLNLATIGWELHKPRIKDIARKVFGKNVKEITFLSAEEILASYPSEHNIRRYSQIIDKIHQSESEARWKNYERKVSLLIKIPFGLKLLDFLSKIYRPKAD